MQRSISSSLAFAVVALTAISADLTTVPAYGQVEADARTFSDRVDVRIINLDVLVTDKKGRPIENLDADDFELFVDGKRTEITNFNRPGQIVTARGELTSGDASRPPTPSHSNATTPGGSVSVSPQLPLVVVHIDSRHTTPSARHRVLGQAMEWIEEVETPARWAIAHVGFSLDQLVTTTDRSKIVANLAELRERKSSYGLEYSTQPDRVLGLLEQYGICSPEGIRAALEHGERRRHETERSFEELAEFTDTLGAIPGPKTLLAIGGGLELHPGVEFFTIIGDECKSATMRSKAASTQLMPQLERLTARANANRVTIHTLEANGLQPLATSSVTVAPMRGTVPVEPGNNQNRFQPPENSPVRGPSAVSAIYSARFQDLQRESFNGSLVEIARLTGGSSVLNRNRLIKPLRQIMETIDQRYSLGFRHQDGPLERHRKIKLRLAPGTKPGKDVQLSYRRSYTVPTEQQLQLSNLRSALTVGSLQNPLGAKVDVRSRTPSQGATEEVLLAIRLPLESLTFLPRGDQQVGELTVYLLSQAVNTDKLSQRHSPMGRRTFPIEMPLERSSTDDSTPRHIALEIPVVLDARRAHDLALSIRDNVAQSSSRVVLHVPAPVRRDQ